MPPLVALPCGRFARPKRRTRASRAAACRTRPRGAAKPRPSRTHRLGHSAGAREPRTAPGQRDPAQGVGVFCDGGARPPVQAMIAFIDDPRAAYGVEPICRVLPIAPSTYHAHAAKRADPAKYVRTSAVGCGLAS